MPGKCPRCQSNVYESKSNFYCEKIECSFALWKNNRLFESCKKNLTKEMVIALLKNGKVKVESMTSPKTGKKFDTPVVIDDDGVRYVNLKCEWN